MNLRVLLAFFVLFNIVTVFAISSNDAVNYVANSNHFLYEGETYTPPNVAIVHEDNEHWVIPVTTGNTAVTYFAISVSSGELSTSRAVNRDLFELAEKLRELQILKSSISSNQGVEWIFTQKYQTIFNEMALQVNDEIFQLNTVETTLNSEGYSNDLSSLKNELRSMSSDVSNISEKIAVASQSENDFVTVPSNDSFSDLDSSFSNVFDSISLLNDSSLSYNSNVDKLKQEISVADIDAQTKSQLFSILEVPQSLHALRNYNMDSTQIKESFESALFASSLRRDSLLDEFDNRLIKNEVNGLIYSDNKSLIEKTDFSSLAQAQAFILSSDNKSLWENQKKVKQLEQNYLRALEFNSERNFGEAKEYALLAVSDAISVYGAGLREVTVPDPGISKEALFMLAGFLVVILILLYTINNRGKIKDMLVEKSEELDVYE